MNTATHTYPPGMGIEEEIVRLVGEAGRLTYVRLLSILRDRYPAEEVERALKRLARSGRLDVLVELRCPVCHAHVGEYRGLGEARAALEEEGHLFCAEGHAVESIDDALIQIVLVPATDHSTETVESTAATRRTARGDAR